MQEFMVTFKEPGFFNKFIAWNEISVLAKSKEEAGRLVRESYKRSTILSIRRTRWKKE